MEHTSLETKGRFWRNAIENVSYRSNQCCSAHSKASDLHAILTSGIQAMDLHALKNLVKPYVPVPARKWIRHQKLKLHRPPEFGRFVSASTSLEGASQRKYLCDCYVRAHIAIDCRHTHEEILAVADAILNVAGEGVVVEAGCFKGGSTAKLSIAAKLAGRKVVVFDSFDGLPAPNPEDARNFYRGEYAGGLDEVRSNVQKYGEISACEFVKGWFAETMPGFRQPVSVAFVDVDLSDSLRTCLKYIYPLLDSNGVIFCHDGHVPTCIALMRDETFWREDVGVEPPHIPGLGKEKFLRIRKGVIVPAR
jgi:O-methyltransferase